MVKNLYTQHFLKIFGLEIKVAMVRNNATVEQN